MANSETYPVIMDSPAPYTWRGVMGSASAAIAAPGLTELGSGTGSAFSLDAAPYFGSRTRIVNQSSATAANRTVVTNATDVTLDTQGSRTITFSGKGDYVDLLGVSTTRWVVTGSRGVTFS